MSLLISTEQRNILYYTLYFFNVTSASKTCGEASAAPVIYFRNPETLPGRCTFKINKANSSITQVKSLSTFAFWFNKYYFSNKAFIF